MESLKKEDLQIQKKSVFSRRLPPVMEGQKLNLVFLFT